MYNHNQPAIHSYKPELMVAATEYLVRMFEGGGMKEEVSPPLIDAAMCIVAGVAYIQPPYMPMQEGDE